MAIVVFCVLSTLWAPRALAAFPGYNGQIATGLGWYDEISVIYPDGSQPGVMASSGLFSDLPHWSPDGSKLFYSAPPDDESPYRLYMVNADGTGAHLVSSTIGEATWSPDGTKIVYSGFDGIYIANPDLTGAVKVPNTQGFDGGVEWSPQGNTLAFGRYVLATNQHAVFRIQLDGTGLTQLTASEAGGIRPLDWSPDGTKIAFERGPFVQAWVMNSDGTGQTQLNPSARAPAWSPDGTKIVFQAPGENLPYTMNPDGTAVKRLTRVIGGASPDWQPCQSPCPPPPRPPYDVPDAQAPSPYIQAPLHFALVPNFRQTISQSQCTARGGVNSNHGAPLAFASCNPPGFVPGTAAHMGANGTYGTSFARFYPRFGHRDPATDGASYHFDVQLHDLRTAGGADYDPNPAGPDVALVNKLRITDSFNGGSANDPGTVVDFDFTALIACIANPNAASGSDCTISSSSDSVVPGAIPEGKNTVVQVFRVRVNDSGSNGVQGDSDDRTFATQGIYIR